MKEHNEFCFSLYDELYSLDNDLSRYLVDSIPPVLDKKIRRYLKQNRANILKLRKSHLTVAKGKIPVTPSDQFEEFAGEKELMGLVTLGGNPDQIKKALDNPLIQLKLIYPGTFSAFVGNAIMARVISTSEMGKRAMVAQFTGAQFISEKRKGNKWGLFFNNNVVQLYTEYDIKSGHSTIEKIYVLKEKSK